MVNTPVGGLPGDKRRVASALPVEPAIYAISWVLANENHFGWPMKKHGC
jgi:hypothetical protein